MRFLTSKQTLASLVALCLAGLAAPAGATNGMYLTGYGAEVVGRGGANLAISDRTLALNFNPAGIVQLQGRHTTVNLSVLAPKLEFENLANQPTDAESRYFPLPAVAYVRAGQDSPLVWGIGFLAQGGMGATFENLNTFFGTRDETYSEVRFMSLSPTVAYSLNEDAAIGATLNIGYADASFRFFPRTSFFNTQNPNFSFFGPSMKRAGGTQYSLRVGGWWRPHPKTSLGLIYQTKTESTFEGGDMTINFTGHPLLRTKVDYTGKMEGFTFAAQAGIGIAYRATDRVLLAADLKRYFWDDAIDTILVVATDPKTAGAPPRVEMPFVFNWKDQWVYALGVEVRTSDRLTLRAGYNHGDNPVPSETLNPLFPATVEDHLTIGFGWLSGNRTYDVAIEHALNQSQTNNNQNPLVNPFGPGARVDHQQWTVSFGVSWAKARVR